MENDTAIRDQFFLDKDVIFFNHGAFGACPKPVFEDYQKWLLKLEKRPEEFLSRRLPEYIQPARQALAEFLKVSGDNLVFIPNATTGMNIVARSLSLGPGDEVLSTTHEYGAVDRTWRFITSKRGARYRPVDVDLPCSDREQFVEQFWQAVSPATRVISISHVTSPTALIFPLKEICRRARERGIITVIDGAHAPGNIGLDIGALDPDFYTGNGHKWLCTPRGAAFLYARPDMQQMLEPLTVSWGYEAEHPGISTFQDYFHWVGTRDVCPYLTFPAALEFRRLHDWDRVRERCRRLAAGARERMISELGLMPLSVDSGEWYGQMFALLFPNQVDIIALEEQLLIRYNLEVSLQQWQEKQLIRVSIQAYNTAAEIDILIEALAQLVSA
ncbi:aminotransferase class V-fold PLP-dependent enzyme [Candidatus Neomarinimicrobiota bacterium]